MKNIHNIYLFTFIVLLIFLFAAFPNVFSNNQISGGDYSIVNSAYLQDSFEKPFLSWNDRFNLGQNNTPFMNYAPYTFLMGFVGQVIQNGVIIERLFWWIPFFVLTFASHFYLRRLLPIGAAGFLSTLIFIFNSYTLMLLGGGQISGVGMAFAIAPIVLVTFIELKDKLDLKHSLIAGLLFAVQVVFDLRIAYVTMFAVILYFLFHAQEIFLTKLIKKIFLIFILPLLITFLLHAFWIMPTLIFHQNPLQDLGAAYSSAEGVKFLSFAQFENSFGLLHPNWPENIFGKVGFMRPEFLLFPLLAFISLLFFEREKDKKTKKHVLFFALLGLIGIFLAKGANDPFGGMYLWMFEHVPGFVMFRDSTKWYLLIVISYSVLIPFSVLKIYDWLKSHVKYSVSNMINVQNLFIVVVIGALLFTIRPVFLGQLGGTFQSNAIPHEYNELNTFLSDQSQFSRTLWVPSVQRYGLHSSQHPAISGQSFFNVTNPQGVVKKLQEPKTQMLLQNAGVKYIIVPYDSEGELFLTDRKYDDKVYQSVVKQVGDIDWLKNKNQFGKVIIYEVPNSKARFWTEEKNETLETNTINATHYQVTANNDIQGKLIFSEQFNPYWVAVSNGQRIAPEKFENTFNSFQLTGPTRTIDVYFRPQEWVDRGIAISLFTLGFCLVLVIIRKKKT